MSLNLSRNAGAIAAAFSALVASGRAPRAQLPAVRAGSLPHGTHVDAWRWRNRSKYAPHQGKRECARRRDRIASRYIVGFIEHESWCASGDDDSIHCNCGAVFKPARRSA